MIYEAVPGRHYYGMPIGILKFGENTGASIPGCVGNATTFSFPVLPKPVEGLTFAAVCRKDKEALPRIIETAKWLEFQGVKAITANCGFFAFYQREVADAVQIPVFLSSLLQVRFLEMGLGGNGKIGILTANSDALDRVFLAGVGISEHSPILIRGLQDKPFFRSHVINEEPILDAGAVCLEVVEAAEELRSLNPNIKAFLLECSELPPYAHAIQEKLHRPVYDYTTMINYIFSGIARKPFDGLY